MYFYTLILLFFLPGFLNTTPRENLTEMLVKFSTKMNELSPIQKAGELSKNVVEKTK